MKKKLIGFTEELVAEIEAFSAEKNHNKSFTDSVRTLIEFGLKYVDEKYIEKPQPETAEDSGDKEDLITHVKNLEREVKKLSWWTSDDNTSRMGDLEVEVKDLTKKLNVIIAASKHFKGHLKDRSIHLQD